MMFLFFLKRLEEHISKHSPTLGRDAQYSKKVKVVLFLISLLINNSFSLINALFYCNLSVRHLPSHSFTLCLLSPCMVGHSHLWQDSIPNSVWCSIMETPYLFWFKNVLFVFIEWVYSLNFITFIVCVCVCACLWVFLHIKIY